MLEGDSEAVINTLRSSEVSLTTYGHLLESAKSSLITSKCIAFSHIRRSDQFLVLGDSNWVPLHAVLTTGFKELI
nr:hypothetical protein CFP56_66955 [Quercus suber]